MEEIPDEKEDELNDQEDILISVQDTFLPQSIKQQALQKQKKELNNAFKFNKSYNQMNEDTKNTSLYDNTFSPKKLILPRIPSAESGNNKNIIIKNIPRNFSSYDKKKKNNNIIPLNNSELFKLKKENEYMISELERLNIELRNLIDKQIPLNNNVIKNNNKINFNKENELNADKKYLRTLITEYNRLYKNVVIGQDLDKLEGLEEKLNQQKKNYNDSIQANKALKNKIIKNEQYMESTKKIRQNRIRNLSDSENKYILFRNKLKSIEKENKRMAKLLEDESLKINQLKGTYSKLEEILNYYEETQENLKKRNEEEIKNKELEKKLNLLVKKREILTHSRESMKKSYENKFENQKKFIKELNKRLNELNEVIKTLSDQ